MKEVRFFQLDTLNVPIKIIRERRRNARAAFGKNAILLRIPSASSIKELELHYNWAIKWLQGIYHKKPKVFERYRAVEYQSGSILKTAYKTYAIHIMRENRKTLAARVKEDVLEIKAPYDLPQKKLIGKVVSRVLGKDQLSWIENKVHHLNHLHFKEEINQIKLRNTATRWGSCNNKGNISISTRCLLAPENILEHIIIHELAHLKEMNHSPAFWAWVKKAEPEYIKHDRWLKENGYRLRF